MHTTVGSRLSFSSSRAGTTAARGTSRRMIAANGSCSCMMRLRLMCTAAALAMSASKRVRLRAAKCSACMQRDRVADA